MAGGLTKRAVGAKLAGQDHKPSKDYQTLSDLINSYQFFFRYKMQMFFYQLLYAIISI